MTGNRNVAGVCVCVLELEIKKRKKSSLLWLADR
jgi:hypothetical protein